MLRVSAKQHSFDSRRMSPERSAKHALAQKHLLRAQCNDAYWHGVFGGIYAPHLRTELWRELIRAETLLDELARARADGLQIEQTDFDGDGSEELYASSKSLTALVRPADGGTLAALDFRPSAVTLINSMQRRPEAYHSRLRDASSAPSRRPSRLDSRSGTQQGRRLGTLSPLRSLAQKCLPASALSGRQDLQRLPGIEAGGKCRPGLRQLRRPGDRPRLSQHGVRNSLPGLRERRRTCRAASLHETLFLCAGKHALSAPLRHAAFLRQRAGPSGAGRNGNCSEFSGAARARPLLRNPLGTASAGLVRGVKGSGDRFAVKGCRRMAEYRRDDRSAWRAGTLDYSDRDDFRIRGRL